MREERINIMKIRWSFREEDREVEGLRGLGEVVDYKRLRIYNFFYIKERKFFYIDMVRLFFLFFIIIQFLSIRILF